MKIDNLDDLAELVKKCIEEQGLNYYQLEKKNPKLTYHAVSKVVNGNNIVSGTLIELFKELNLEIIKKGDK